MTGLSRLLRRNGVAHSVLGLIIWQLVTYGTVVTGVRMLRKKEWDSRRLELEKLTHREHGLVFPGE